MNWIVAYLSIITSLCLGGKLKLKSENPPFAPSYGYYKAKLLRIPCSLRYSHQHIRREAGRCGGEVASTLSYLHTLYAATANRRRFWVLLSSREGEQKSKEAAAANDSCEGRERKSPLSQPEAREASKARSSNLKMKRKKPSKAQKTPWKQPAGRLPVTASFGEIIREDEIDKLKQTN